MSMDGQDIGNVTKLLNESAPFSDAVAKCTDALIYFNGTYQIFTYDGNETSVKNFSQSEETDTLVAGCASVYSSADSSLSPISAPRTSLSSLYEPFFLSGAPQSYSMSASVVTAWVLVCIVFLTLRPWLQRVATIFMAILLTLATALQTSELHQQYKDGKMDSESLRSVLSRTSIGALTVVAVFLARLSEIQVLIRIYPRHRDKQVIKYVGLALSLLELVFAIVDRFVRQPLIPLPSTASITLSNAILACQILDYLFQIGLAAIFLIGAVYYSISMQRYTYSYWGPQAQNLLLAFLSIVSNVGTIILPILTIWNSKIKGWAEPSRLIMLIAGIVLVWEWVIRIESLVVLERKGVLGREIFEDEFQTSQDDLSMQHPRSDGRSVVRHLGHRMKAFLPRKRSDDMGRPVEMEPPPAPNVTSPRRAAVPPGLPANFVPASGLQAGDYWPEEKVSGVPEIDNVSSSHGSRSSGAA